MVLGRYVSVGRSDRPYGAAGDRLLGGPERSKLFGGGARGLMFAPRRARGGEGENLRFGRTIETLMIAPSIWDSCMCAMAASASASEV